MVEKDPKTAAQDQINTVGRLIREAEPRSEVVVVGWKDGVNSISLDNQSSSRNKHREVFFIAVQGAEVFVAQPEVHVQLAGQLPGILEIQVVGVYLDEALRITDGDRRGRHVTGKKISKCLGVGIYSRVSCPESLCPVEGKFPRAAPVIELIHVRVPNLASETQLVLANNVGNNVGQVAGNVIAALGRCEADLLKARDDNVGRAMNGFSVNGRVGAEEQTHGLGVETVVEIVKGLV